LKAKLSGLPKWRSSRTKMLVEEENPDGAESAVRLAA
jgi:hypothetical protein